MATWIALFRGINVGGNNILPMAKLKSDLESLKLKNVRTYIQSGNVIFDSTAKSAPGLAKKISDQVEKKHGFRPNLVLLKKEELLDAIRLNPFPQAVEDPKTLSFFFLAEDPATPDMKAIENARIPSEKFKLIKRVFYLNAPDGFGRSKLAANAEKWLGVATTARNYRTVEKLLTMVNE